MVKIIQNKTRKEKKKARKLGRKNGNQGLIC
jgi:hypothetical protein